MARFKAMGCAGWLVRPLRASSLIERIYVVKTGGLPVDEPEKLTGAGRVLIAERAETEALAKALSISLWGIEPLARRDQAGEVSR